MHSGRRTHGLTGRLTCLIWIPVLGHQLEDDEGGTRRMQEE